MTDIGAVIDRMQFRLGTEALPEEAWRTFLDQVRGYSEKIERKLRALRSNRERLLAIVDLIPVAFFVKDDQSRFFLMNRACEEQWGMAFADIRDTDASQFFPPEQMAHFLATDRAIFETRQPVEFEETFWSAAKQSNRLGYTFKRPMYDAAGNPLYLVCVTIDITERKLAETALRDSETRFRNAIAHSPNPMMMHAEDGKVIMISEALTAITCFGMDDLPTTQAWAEKAYAIPADESQRRLEALYELTAIRFEGEFPVKTRSGETRLWEIQNQPLPKLPDGRRVILMLGVDITDRKRMEQELRTLATTDALTGLPNRRQFLADLDAEFARATRFDGQQSSVLMLDLDLFKEINDTHGHAVGDAVLKQFTRRLRDALRVTDTAGRLGGEEFGVILPGAGSADAQAFAERVREALAVPLMADGKMIPLTVSIGIAGLDPGAASADLALTRADQALYRAKQNGRNRVELAEPERAATAA